MAIARVGTPNVVVITTASTAWSIPITAPAAGEMLAVFIATSLGPTSSVTSVTDNATPATTYVLSAKGGNTGSTNTMCYIAVGKPTGTPTTLTVNVSSGTGKVCVARFSGVGALPSTGHGAAGGAASATSFTAPAFTGAGVDDLILGCVDVGGTATNARTLGAGSGGWTRLDTLATYTDTAIPHIGAAYKIATAAGASEQHAWTVASAAAWGHVTSTVPATVTASPMPRVTMGPRVPTG